jgi:hypothetical protein
MCGVFAYPRLKTTAVEGLVDKFHTSTLLITASTHVQPACYLQMYVLFIYLRKEFSHIVTPRPFKTRHKSAGLEVLTADVLSHTYRDTTPCSPLKDNRCFGGTCRLHLQGIRISQARNQSVDSSKEDLILRPEFDSRQEQRVFIRCQDHPLYICQKDAFSVVYRIPSRVRGRDLMR